MQASVSAITSDNPDPLWLQTVNHIKHEVLSGDLAPGTRLASERELTEHWGISRVTLRKALQHLVTEGVLSSSHGRGWYVASGEPAREFPNTLESFTETAARMGLRASASVLSETRGSASVDEAEVLSIAPGAPILRLERLRKLDDVAIALDSSTVPLAALPDLDGVDFAHASIFDLLTASGYAPERADSTVEAAPAGVGEAELLGVEVGTPLLVMRQVTHRGDGKPVAISAIKYVGERYRLRTVFYRSH